jgi:hypothetical protein
MYPRARSGRFRMGRKKKVTTPAWWPVVQSGVKLGLRVGAEVIKLIAVIHGGR